MIDKRVITMSAIEHNFFKMSTSESDVKNISKLQVYNLKPIGFFLSFQSGISTSKARTCVTDFISSNTPYLYSTYMSAFTERLMTRPAVFVEINGTYDMTKGQLT